MPIEHSLGTLAREIETIKQKAADLTDPRKCRAGAWEEFANYVHGFRWKSLEQYDERESARLKVRVNAVLELVEGGDVAAAVEELTQRCDALIARLSGPQPADEVTLAYAQKVTGIPAYIWTRATQRPPHEHGHLPSVRRGSNVYITRANMKRFDRAREEKLEAGYLRSDRKVVAHAISKKKK